MGLVLASVTAVAQSTNGPGPQGDKVQQQSQDLDGLLRQPSAQSCFPKLACPEIQLKESKASEMGQRSAIHGISRGEFITAPGRPTLLHYLTDALLLESTQHVSGMTSMRYKCDPHCIDLLAGLGQCRSASGRPGRKPFAWR